MINSFDIDKLDLRPELVESYDVESGGHGLENSIGTQIDNNGAFNVRNYKSLKKRKASDFGGNQAAQQHV